MKKLLLLAMAVVLVVGSSCKFGLEGPPPPGEDADVNNANMAKLSVGMTKVQVLEIMGPAAKTEAYETKSGGILEFLMYANRYYPSRDSEWTPICLIDGKVKGWGRNFFDDTIKIRKEIIKN